MENNIDSSKVYNRKVILEIRFDSNPLVVDKKGELAKKLISSDLIPGSSWEIGNSDLRIADDLNGDQARQVVFVDSHRMTVVCSNSHTAQRFLHLVEKAYKACVSILGPLEITRIGCRIMGTYKSASTQFLDIVDHFKEMFPTQLLIEDFSVKDLRFQLIYQNGQYHIGPINKDDEFTKREFKFDGVVNEVGIGIDTDNYILKGKEKTVITDKSIKDVYMASLSVEKSLFDKLSSL